MSHTPRKRFGQNFLQDTQVIDQIIHAIDPQPHDNLVEIGPGQGALTAPLLKHCGKLSVIEIDRDLGPELKQRFGDHLILHQADVLKFDFSTLGNAQKLRVVGNLPYNISSPLLFHLLAFLPYIQDMHFMLQAEVVKRMAAEPGSKLFGRLSVMMQYHCKVTPLLHVPPNAFHPAPKVDSMVFRLTPHQHSPYEAVDTNTLSQIVKLGFAQRRKTLANNLKGAISVEQLTQLGINPNCRAETLPIQAWVRLATTCSKT